MEVNLSNMPSAGPSARGIRATILGPAESQRSQFERMIPDHLALSLLMLQASAHKFLLGRLVNSYIRQPLLEVRQVP